MSCMTSPRTTIQRARAKANDRIVSAPRRAAPRLPSKTTGYAVIWLSLGAFVFLALNAAVSPKVARPIVTEGNEAVTIERSRDQHFYVEGAINGHPVTFLVDTGASLVSVSNELALRSVWHQVRPPYSAPLADPRRAAPCQRQAFAWAVYAWMESELL